jgi:hypothetical protein
MSLNIDEIARLLRPIISYGKIADLLLFPGIEVGVFTVFRAFSIQDG